MARTTWPFTSTELVEILERCISLLLFTHKSYVKIEHFASFDYKCHGTINARHSSCVASRNAVGVYCHHWPLTSVDSRVARAPASIPLCAQLRTAVLETERDWTLATALLTLRVSESATYLHFIRYGHVANQQHRVKTGTYPTIYWTEPNRWLDIGSAGGRGICCLDAYASLAWTRVMSRAETAFIRLANDPNHSWSVHWP